MLLSRADAFEVLQDGCCPFEGAADGGAADRMDWMETEGSDGGGGGLVGDIGGWPTPGGGDRRAAWPLDT